ncbi:MAG: hypothetical protein ACO1N4_00120 [Pedobacter sp.]
MNRHKEYNLAFARNKNSYGDGSEYHCFLENKNDIQFYSLADKLGRMGHPVAAQGLLNEITAAENNDFYEPYYALDADMASDDDEIEIVPPNIVIDKYLYVSFGHMKEILQEWIDFMNK